MIDFFYHVETKYNFFKEKCMYVEKMHIYSVPCPNLGNNTK